MYDNILNNFEFEGSRAKVKVTVAILEKNIVIARVPSFCCNFTQMFSMKYNLIKFKFQLSRAKVNVKVALLRNMLLAIQCFNTNFRYGNILGMFVFQHKRVKVKVTVAVKRKLFSLFWPSHL